MVKIGKKIFWTKHHNLHANRKPLLDCLEKCYFRNIYGWFSRKKSKNYFLLNPKKSPFSKIVFRSTKIRKAYFLIYNLISLINIYKKKRKRSNFRLYFTFLCQFWVAIPDGSICPILINFSGAHLKSCEC